MSLGSSDTPNLLTIVPPYAIWGPPAGSAALLAYLKAAGCRDFRFLDLRLLAPDITTPTYRSSGPFGESFVMDVPDLPLVLAVLERFRQGEDLLDLPDDVVEPYCFERGLNSLHLRAYLRRMGNLVESAFSRVGELDFVGFSVWTSNYLTTLLAAAYLKRRRRPPFVVAGGPQVSQSTASARLALRAGVFDSVVTGEGEETLLQLYKSYSPQRRALDGQVAGALTYDASSRTFREEPRALLRLKELPLPDFDEMHLPAYAIRGQRTVSYQLSRGCTDKCSFCSEWVFWRHFRLTNMEKAVVDVAELQRRWGAQRIWFTDSLLNGQMNRLREFAEGLLSRGVQIDWNGYMRAQIDAPTAQLLRRAGCTGVFVGVESLADETLGLMNKRMSEQQNLAAVQTFLDAGISVQAGLIPGFPGDTRERFLRTAKILRKMQGQYAQLTVSHEAFVVLPGQPIYKDLGKFGLRPVPWSDDVLGIAPELTDIARDVWCRVEGANQGMERMGEYLVSVSLTGPAQPGDDISVDMREAITPYALSMSPMGGGIWLGRTLSPRGHTVGLILSEAEYGWFLARGAANKSRLTALCETGELGERFSALLAQHPLQVSLDSAPAVPMRYRSLGSPLPASARLVPGPLTLARRMGDTLWLANLATGEASSLPATEELALALLSGGELALGEGGIALADLGLLVYAELPPVEEPLLVPPLVSTPEGARLPAAHS